MRVATADIVTLTKVRLKLGVARMGRYHLVSCHDDIPIVGIGL